MQVRAIAGALALPTALFAVHTFLLMGTGAWADEFMAGEAFRVTFYYIREAALLAGFLCAAALAKLLGRRGVSRRAARGLLIAPSALFAGCAFLQLIAFPVTVGAAAIVCAFLIGLSGGVVYARVARLASRVPESEGDACDGGRHAFDSQRSLGIVVGIGGALAVLAQCAVQAWLSFGAAPSVLFAVCFALMAVLLGLSDGGFGSLADGPAHGMAADGPVRGRRLLLSAVLVSAFLLALFPIFEVALRDFAAGALFYRWHRLFLAVGYFVVGAAAFMGGRSAASRVTGSGVLFSVVFIMQVASGDAGPAAAVLFYALLGAVIAWNAVMFMSVAPTCANPVIVASAGRVIEGAVTLAGVAIPLAGRPPAYVAVTVALGLLAVALAVMGRAGMLMPGPQARGGERLALAGAPAVSAVMSRRSTGDRVAQMAADCELTERERAVLAALVLTEDTNQKIANDLGISRRQVQNHIARIYEKTGTQSRTGLVMRFGGM